MNLDLLQVQENSPQKAGEKPNNNLCLHLPETLKKRLLEAAQETQDPRFYYHGKPNVSAFIIAAIEAALEAKNFITEGHPLSEPTVLPSQYKHSWLADKGRCRAWCRACDENKKRGLNKDGTAL